MGANRRRACLSALHLYNGPSLNGLIAIEYAFHVTSIGSGVLLASSLLWLTRDRLTRGAAPGMRT